MKIYSFAAYLSLILLGLFYSNPCLAQSVDTAKNQAKEGGDTPAAATITNAPPPKKLWKHGSMMLDKKSYEWLNEAVKSFEQKIPLEILLPNLFPSAQQTKIVEEEKKKATIKDDPLPVEEKPVARKEVPNFYLKSILYLSPESWSVRVNDTKISPTKPDIFENITLTKLSHKKAFFLWKYSQIDATNPNWKDNLIEIGDDKFASRDKNIVVDANTGHISFVMKPNQSFLPKTLEIIEGSQKQSSSPNAMTSTTPKSNNDSSATTVENTSNTGNNKTIDTPDTAKALEMLKSLLDKY